MTTAPGLLAEAIVGAFLALCIWWMNDGPTLTPTEVDRVFRSLVGDGLVRGDVAHEQQVR